MRAQTSARNRNRHALVDLFGTAPCLASTPYRGVAPSRRQNYLRVSCRFHLRADVCARISRPMNAAANDTNAKTSNATHSVALAAIGGEFVLSAFAVVAGEVDTDREIVFQAFTDASIARRAYTQASALLSCNATAFDRAIDHVHHCRVSLASCLHREVRTEALSLMRAVAELEIASLARRNPAREERKARALCAAVNVLSSRAAGLDAKLQAEAVKRAAAGQS